MKREEAARILGVTGQTVVNWRLAGKIKAYKKQSGHYDYDNETIYNLAAQTDLRMTIAYCRSTEKQDLEEQKKCLTAFCESMDWQIDETILEVSTGITFDKRRNFIKLLELVERNKVKRVIIADKNILSQTGFDMFERLFEIHGTEIIVTDLSEEQIKKSEILDELISLLTCYN